MKFRTDINGLRTYAVLAVIIFHFNKSWLPGGFAGVDVFFVISGYLMTSIIFRGIENQSFSLWRFYSARIRRIIPALLVLIVILMIFGYLFLAPIPYRELAKHSGGSLLFISNFMYWQEAGYFDAEAIEKFLLHTWSLSVEWQFYIIYPVILLLLAKLFSAKTIKKIIAIATIFAFFFAVYSSFKWNTASYFLLPARIWEMLLGGIVFLYPLQLSKAKHKHILELTGLALVIISFFIISENTIWPGYMALIPTLGAFILLQANNDKSIFTNNLIAQKIGLWSYSLYLWHWPILVTYNYFNYKVGFLPFLLITLICGIGSYYFIEKKKWSILVITSVVVVVLVSILIIYKTNGAAYRVSPELSLTQGQFRSKYEGHMGRSNNVEVTYFNSTEDDFEYILLGNSHARHYFSYIDKSNIKLAEITLDGCFSMKNHYTSYDKENCMQVYDLTIDFIRKNPNKKIIISYALPGQAINRQTGSVNTEFNEALLNEELDALMLEITNSNSIAFFVGDTPRSKNSMFSCLAESQLIGPQLLNKSCSNKEPLRTNENNKKLAKYAQGNKNAYYIDPTPALCDDKYCSVLTIDNKLIYTDTDHLSIYGADIVGKYIFDEIKKDQ